jgi:hypothetical protein
MRLNHRAFQPWDAGAHQNSETPTVPPFGKRHFMFFCKGNAKVYSSMA